MRQKILGLIPLVFAIILLITVVRFLASDGSADPLTITGFLEICKDAPQIPLDWVSALNTNFASTFPPELQWLGSFIDTIANIMQLPLISSTMLLNFVPLILYFLQYVFAF